MLKMYFFLFFNATTRKCKITFVAGVRAHIFTSDGAGLKYYSLFCLFFSVFNLEESPLFSFFSLAGNLKKSSPDACPTFWIFFFFNIASLCCSLTCFSTPHVSSHQLISLG